MQFFAPVLVCLSLIFSHQSIAASLIDTVRATLERHPELELAETIVERQRLALTQVESGFLPRLSLSAGIGREDSNNTSTRARNGGSEEMERRESAMTIRQMLFDGFETHWKQKGQETRIAVAERELAEKATRIVLDGVALHLDSIEAAGKFDFSMESFQAHERIAEGVRARVKSGKDDRAKVAQVEARLSLALANLETARSALLQVQARYRELAGELPAEALQEPAILPELSPGIEELKQSVLENHPLLQARSLSYQAAKQHFKASQSNRFPDLYLDAGASWNDNLDGVEGRNSDAFAMLRLQYDLYRGGARKAERNQARLEQEQSRLEHDLLHRELISEAEQLWFAMRSTQKQLAFLEDYIGSAEITREAYRKQFNIGQRSLIDLLDAENEVMAARDKWLSARREYHWLVYRLSALEGRLLDQLTLPGPVQI